MTAISIKSGFLGTGRWSAKRKAEALPRLLTRE